MELFKEPYLTIDLPEEAILVAEWTGVPSVEQFKTGNLKMMELAGSHPGAQSLVFNFYNLAAWLDLETQVWAINECFPRLVKGSQKKKAAVLVPVKVMSQIVVKSIFTGVAAKLGSQLEIIYLSVEAELNQWLSAQGVAVKSATPMMTQPSAMAYSEPTLANKASTDLFNSIWEGVYQDPVVKKNAAPVISNDDIHDDPFAL